jgi:WD40-like Beta Propeller Repeat
MNRDGTGLREVVPSTFGLEHPDWSPDGRWISFNIAPEVPGAAVMAVHPDGSGLHVIRRNNKRFEVYKPVWSPDGRKFLAVCFDVQTQIEKLCTMNPNGRNLHVVVATPDFVNFPAWGSHPPTRSLINPLGLTTAASEPLTSPRAGSVRDRLISEGEAGHAVHARHRFGAKPGWPTGAHGHRPC